MQRKGGQKAVGSTRVEAPVRAPARASAPAAAPAKEVRPAVVPARPGGNVAAVSPEPRPAFAPLIEMNQGEAEHRHFPRAQLATRFEVWVDDEAGERRFEASLVSVNVSVSGAFLESTFYLPLGTVLGVRFALEPGAAPVQARAEIVREERENGPEGRSGFGVRFLDFSGQTEVALARLFVGMRLRAFAEDYLKSQRARSLPNEVERVVDVLAAWELLKATSSVSDPWQG
ncbi:PilZ domain-containing protein [Myxococcus sp. AM009]|uniref:PilZ domain-containing protein n=1 Tax=unclassified Myxococcus TaxID=2648731 RepID=UPI001595B957|nr:MULTISPECIES: PilZ domain-containing protein [unclassified Myxococcus]NVI97890.1 PilZ domain-containing protein [Myxococcus sp. AM009]NVJ12986.1 PilZ domain-containing protein [Myxococcus sp. AM010]